MPRSPRTAPEVASDAVPPTAPSPAPIGDVNTPLVAPAATPTLPEVMTGPPQFSPQPPGPHPVRILSDVTIKTPPYQNFKFQMVKNFKMRLWDTLTGKDGSEFDAQCRALGQIVLKHYDWCDDEGNLLPRIEDDPVAFVNELAMDQHLLLLRAIYQEGQRLPDFPDLKR